MAAIPNGLFGVIARKNVAGGGVSYVLEEDFEETGIPSSGVWAVTAGSADWDSTPPSTSPNGGETLKLVGENNDVDADGIGLELYCQFYIVGSGFATTPIVGFDGAIRNAEISVNASGTITLRAESGTVTVNFTDSYSTGVWYHLKMVLDPGVKVSAEFSTDGTFSGSGNKYAELTTNLPTVEIKKIDLRGRRDSTIYFDRVIISENPISDNP